MKTTVTIFQDNDAFKDGNLRAETARILRELADKIEAGQNPQGLTARDINGNRVAITKVEK